MGKYNYSKDEVLHDSRFLFTADGKHIIAECNGEINAERNMEILARLASCWNACINLENPQEDIKKLVEALRVTRINLKTTLEVIKASPVAIESELRPADEALSLFKEAK